MKKRKAKGDKNVPWDEEGPVLYALIIDVHGTDRIRVHVKKTHPVEADVGSVMMSSATEYEALRQWIVDNHWDGKKATFRWTALKNGSTRLGSDVIQFDDDIAQQHKWNEKKNPTPVAVAQQQVSGQTATQIPNGATVVLQQPAPAPAVSPGLGSGALDVLLNRLDRIESSVAASSRASDDDDDDDDEQEEPDPDDLGMADEMPARRPPPARPMPRPAPSYSQPPMMPEPSRMTPMPHVASEAAQWEQVMTPQGTLAWIKKPVVQPPPPDLPDPMPGYAWQCLPSGHWVQVPIEVPKAAQPTAVAPAQVSAQPAAPMSAVATESSVSASERERELMQQAHKLSTELAVLQERYKWMGEINKVRADVASMAAAGAVPVPVPAQQAAQPQAVAPANATNLPPPPPGYAYTQQVPGGPWMLVPIQTAAPAAAPQEPATVPDQLRTMADTLKSLNSFANAAKTVFPSPKDEGPAQVAGALAEASEKETPLLDKVDAGGWQMWFDPETRKPVDTMTQIALNMGNLREAGKGIITEAMDGYRKIIEQQESGKVRKLEKDRAEMGQFIREQQQELRRVQQEIRRLQYERHADAHPHAAGEEPPYEPPEPDPSPPVTMGVNQSEPESQAVPEAAAPPTPSSSLAAGALSVFRRKS